MADPFRYDGRRAVVTGGASGVGAALVEVLSELGASHITVLDVREPTGPADRFLPTDLADPASVDAAIADIDGPVHALFNNAGVAATQAPKVVLSVNVLALRRLSEGLLDRIPDGGAIVNTASIAGAQWPDNVEVLDQFLDLDWDGALAWLAEHETSLPADSYSFSKQLVQRWTLRSSHTTLARGVRTNSVCPAPIDTPLLPDFRQTMTEKVIDWCVGECGGRLVTAREVATALAFLGSEAASFVNGVNLNVDNGFAAAMATNQVDFAGLA
jgi:NAD(P)-dependent dehydrogenase (short-subunit alcohol dehydrogenase family)